MPDDRLDRLAEVFKPKKIVHADVTYVDLPAPPASSEGRVGTEELPAEHLARLRESDALIHVVRAWDDAAHPHPAGSVDAARDLEQLDLEFMLADLAMVDRRLERLPRVGGRHGTPAEREANEREEVILVRLKAALEGGSPIRDDAARPGRGEGDPRLPVPDPEAGARAAQRRRGRPRGARPRSSSGSAAATRTSTRWSTRCPRRSRWSWASSTPDEAAVFMEELGLAESSLDRVIALSYRLVGLISFLTAGPGRGPRLADPRRVERRRRRGRHPHRPRAGLHPRRDDRVRGPAGRWARSPRRRSHGKVRSEGKTYRVRDGDVIEILFSR